MSAVFMKCALVFTVLSAVTAYLSPVARRRGFLNMVATPERSKVNNNAGVVPNLAGAPEEPKLSSVERIKINSNYLRAPLDTEMEDEKIYVDKDAVVVLKYHGSYMQDNREQRVRGEQKKYSFMLRLKSPCGEVTPELYRELDNMADKFGQNDLRATTRQAWQLHGILKGDLKSVISTIMKAGSSSVGACGDVSRNVMCSPAPFETPEYKYARQYSKVFAELFKPQSQAFTELWMGEEKVAKMEYWMKDIDDLGINIQDAMRKDQGTGIITDDPVEPLYGNRYLPRKFKMGVTVPGDNSLDIYTNDIGWVVVCDKEGRLEGFNVMVGGGMGRTHMKDTTFARTADHLGFVSADDALELGKAILATQRDHGNREIRANSRMKYLVHETGIDAFREIVEGYFGKKVEPWRKIKAWKYADWMGWHEQGDGNHFLGINVESGRVRDFEDGPQYKTAVREIVDKFGLTMVLTPTQSIIFRDIKPEDKKKISYILRKHGVKAIRSIDPLVRHSMACPALPLCGLAVTEAERRMPDWADRVRSIMDELGLSKEKIMMRMTGCPNGCARPYMAELALVGDGPDKYQIWVGGSPALTRLASTLSNKVTWGEDMDAKLTQLLTLWRDNRTKKEAFGDFCDRMGVDRINFILDPPEMPYRVTVVEP